MDERALGVSGMGGGDVDVGEVAGEARLRPLSLLSLPFSWTALSVSEWFLSISLSLSLCGQIVV